MSNFLLLWTQPWCVCSSSFPGKILMKKIKGAITIRRWSNFCCKTCFPSLRLINFWQRTRKIQPVSLETQVYWWRWYRKIVKFFYSPWPRNHFNEIINNSWTSFTQASIVELYFCTVRLIHIFKLFIIIVHYIFRSITLIEQNQNGKNSLSLLTYGLLDFIEF